jgi:glycosyltransferase involved in cell wall biosynthesis
LKSAIAELDAILVPSAFSGELHKQLDLDIPIHLLPNFSPSQGYSGELDESLIHHADRPYFLFVGRLEHAKGIHSILPLFRDLRDVDLLVAGEGTHARSIQRQAEDMDNVHFLGWVNAQQLVPLYRSAVAVVVPSLWYEVCPLVILEAFKHGTPVLARNLGGMRELVAANGAGAVFRSPSDLLDRMKGLLESPTLRESWSQRARQAHLEHYSAQSHLRQYFEILNSIAGREYPSKDPEGNNMRAIDGDA